ncbi:hypothetical protein LguiB_031418 [Lonicera macranthoides]
MDLFNNDFSLQDFTSEENFEQFIALIRGETEDPIVNLCENYYECEQINGCGDLLVDHNGQQYQQRFVFGDLGGDGNAGSNNINDSNSLLINLAKEAEGGINNINNEAEEEEEEGEYSSATMTTGTMSSGPLKRSGGKVDRSRTLVSERRRRGRMKEKLYALRSLVPNITKMDKASIVGDAALYVQDLQMQAKNLRAEIAALESSLTGTHNKLQGPSTYDNNSNNIQLTNIHNKIIQQMGVYQVEERVFYVRLVCNKGEGVASSLYKAIDSFTNFDVHSSNLSTVADNFLYTFTMHVGECSELGMNLPNLKLWIAGALLNQGFDFKTSISP